MQLSTKYIGRLVSSSKGTRFIALPLLLVTMMVLAGCSIGSYPLDFFQEMHYGQNYRVQEEPRERTCTESIQNQLCGMSWSGWDRIES